MKDPIKIYLTRENFEKLEAATLTHMRFVDKELWDKRTMNMVFPPSYLFSSTVIFIEIKE